MSVDFIAIFHLNFVSDFRNITSVWCDGCHLPLCSILHLAKSCLFILAGRQVHTAHTNRTSYILESMYNEHCARKHTTWTNSRWAHFVCASFVRWRPDWKYILLFMPSEAMWRENCCISIPHQYSGSHFCTERVRGLACRCYPSLWIDVCSIMSTFCVCFMMTFH